MRNLIKLLLLTIIVLLSGCANDIQINNMKAENENVGIFPSKSHKPHYGKIKKAFLDYLKKEKFFEASVCLGSYSNQEIEKIYENEGRSILNWHFSCIATQLSSVFLLQIFL